MSSSSTTGTTVWMDRSDQLINQPVKAVISSTSTAMKPLPVPVSCQRPRILTPAGEAARPSLNLLKVSLKFSGGMV